MLARVEDRPAGTLGQGSSLIQAKGAACIGHDGSCVGQGSNCVFTWPGQQLCVGQGQMVKNPQLSLLVEKRSTCEATELYKQLYALPLIVMYSAPRCCTTNSLYLRSCSSIMTLVSRWAVEESDDRNPVLRPLRPFVVPASPLPPPRISSCWLAVLAGLAGLPSLKAGAQIQNFDFLILLVFMLFRR